MYHMSILYKRGPNKDTGQCFQIVIDDVPWNLSCPITLFDEEVSLIMDEQQLILICS
jgi:hypothetical protein